jgi:hypothetical protein
LKNKTIEDKKAVSKEMQTESPSRELGSQDITGRAVFVVDTSGAGIVVRTGFLSEQGQFLDMPAVFPDLSYALNQIDHLRQLVIGRFTQAAQVGVQVIAAQQQAQAARATEGQTVESEITMETIKA